MQGKSDSNVHVPQDLARVLALARAVKEDAAAGAQTPNYLIWQLAAAVEQLAAAMARSNGSAAN